MIKTTCDIPLVKLANKNLKPQKYLKKADSAPVFSKIEDGGVEVKVVTPILHARILLIFVPSTSVESLKKNMSISKCSCKCEYGSRFYLAQVSGVLYIYIYTVFCRIHAPA